VPELPDLVYIQKRLSATVAGRRIVEVAVKEPIVLRMLLSEHVERALPDKAIRRVLRHGPFLQFILSGNLEVVVHPMLAGRFKLLEHGEKPGRGLCFSLRLDDDRVLHYLDDRKMGKAYVIPSREHAAIPRFVQQGIDILSRDFSAGRFRTLIAGQRKQVRVFLMDQTQLSAIGNAYADEILFEARLHPKTFCNRLSPEDVGRLYTSIVSVMRWAIAEVEGANRPVDEKVRGHVRVRNRKDEACPRCGSTIRRAGVLGYDAFFCPTCQPATRKQFIEWQ